MRIINRPWIFELGAGIYAWFNSQDVWRNSCAGLAAHFPNKSAGRPFRVLDLGCGPGVTVIELAHERPDAFYVGLDLARRMLDIARVETARENMVQKIAFVLADATALPFADNSFDVTTGHSFLYLVPDRSGVLREAFRVLHPEGRYVSMEPRDGDTNPGWVKRHWTNFRFMFSVLLWRPYSKFHGRLDEEKFPALLERAGFKNTGTERVIEGLGIIGYGEK